MDSCKESRILEYERFFENYWNELFIRNGSNDRIDLNVWRQADFIHLVLLDETPIAILIQNKVKFDFSSFGSTYFADPSGCEFYERLLLSGAKTGITMEYLTINPIAHRLRLGFRAHELVIEVGLLNQERLSVDAALGKCRSDVVVSKHFQERGARLIVPNVVLHNTPTDFCALFLGEKRPPENPLVTEVAQSLMGQPIFEEITQAKSA